jgi:nucleotide-binding universal stress UspA family protein
MDRHGISHDFACIESKNALVWDEVVEAGIAADLILLGASRRDIEKSVEDYYAEEVIMRSGRPVIILPYEGLRTLTIDTIVAGWNGKREAARAIFDALPLLKRAQKVHLVSISRSGEQQAGPPEARARIMRTLARHQVPLQADSIAADGSDAGRVLMKHAEKLGAGLTIMGAYGHARNREYVFGGATFEMLLHMNRPVLMAN